MTSTLGERPAGTASPGENAQRATCSTPLYTLTLDAADSVVVITMTGLWNVEMMPGYIQDLRKLVTQCMVASGRCRVLVDMSAYPIQVAAIAEGHGRLLDQARQQAGVSVAVVMPSALSKLQAKRVTVEAGHAFFDDVASARRHLMAS